jgi:hypothetical protein
MLTSFAVRFTLMLQASFEEYPELVFCWKTKSLTELRLRWQLHSCFAGLLLT